MIARKIKPSIFRFSMKNSYKILEIGKIFDFAHPYVPLKLFKIRCVKIIFDENV
jgi:hypothetical protein